MAYFLFRTQIISKSNRSAVACAAYRSGEALYSERDGLTKNTAIVTFLRKLIFLRQNMLQSGSTIANVYGTKWRKLKNNITLN